MIHIIYIHPWLYGKQARHTQYSTQVIIAEYSQMICNDPINIDH